MIQQPKTYEEMEFNEFEEGSYWESRPAPTLFSETTDPFDLLHDQRFRDALRRAIERKDAENAQLRERVMELEDQLRKATAKRRASAASPSRSG